MRICYVTMLTVVVVVANTNAMLNSDQVTALNSSPSAGKDFPVQRFLRKRETIEDTIEERGGFKDIADKIQRKAAKLVKYNMWIFGNKSPAWVAQNHPEFANGYNKFWENRMVRGGKYN
ncbi:RxLR effector protein [Phytophthora megakarya]|uniref:RxLR effector protein n=1 Tax=Phytophthora megakarya TaxID=4795 RepID=A0A225VTT2_9STRA|nr:RxLR effector protein [Phytophthora megakarya]